MLAKLLIGFNDLPLLDLYLVFSNVLSIDTYKNLFRDFCELWGVDVHVFVKDFAHCENLFELLDILEKLPLNTYSFADGIREMLNTKK